MVGAGWILIFLETVVGGIIFVKSITMIKSGGPGVNVDWTAATLFGVGLISAALSRYSSAAGLSHFNLVLRVVEAIAFFAAGALLIYIGIKRMKEAFKMEDTDLEKSKWISISIVGLLLSVGALILSLSALNILIDVTPLFALIIGIFIPLLPFVIIAAAIYEVGRGYTGMKERETPTGVLKIELENLRERMERLESKIDRIQEILETVSG